MMKMKKLNKMMKYYGYQKTLELKGLTRWSHEDTECRIYYTHKRRKLFFGQSFYDAVGMNPAIWEHFVDLWEMDWGNTAGRPVYSFMDEKANSIRKVGQSS